MNKVTRILILIFSIVAIYGGQFIKLTGDSTIFFNKSSKELQLIKQFEQEYGTNNSVIITLLSKDRGTVFTQQNIEYIDNLVKKLKDFPNLISINSITQIKRVKKGMFGVKSEQLFSKSENFEESVQWLLNNNSYQNYLVSSDGLATAIELKFNIDSISVGEDVKLVDSLRSTVSDFLSKSEIEPYFTGGLFINRAFSVAGLHDAKTLTPIMVIVILLVALMFYKSYQVILPLAFSILPVPMIVMGVIGWLSIPFSSTTAVVPIISIAIAFATTTHILYSIKRAKGNSDKEILHNAIKESFKPILVTSATTVVGFLALNFSKTPPFRELGNLSALGTIISALFSLTIFPYLLSGKIHYIKNNFYYSSGSFLVSSIYKYYKLIIIFSIILFLFALQGVTKLEANDSFINYFSNKTEFRKDSDTTLKYLTGIDYLQVSIKPKDQIYSKEYYKKISQLNKKIDTFDDVRYSISYSKLMDSFSEFFKYRSLPPTPKTAKKLLNRVDTPVISKDKSSSQIFIIFNKIESKKLRELSKEIEKLSVEYFSDSQVRIGSTSLLFANLSLQNQKSMNWGIVISLILITATLLISTKSLKYSLISFVPNIIPIIISFGIWGIIFHKGGLGLSVVAPIVLGIIVDDTVHSIIRYIRQRENGATVKESILLYFEELFTPMIVTSIVLSLAFFSLLTSSFQPTREMGGVAGLVIFIALIGDLLLLPSLFIIFDKD
jgi:predicted RND superfamily exporter protein